MSDVVRLYSSISFHLRKLLNAKFSILYDISLVRDRKRNSWLITPGSERVNKQPHCKTNEDTVTFDSFPWGEKTLLHSQTANKENPQYYGILHPLPGGRGQNIEN